MATGKAVKATKGETKDKKWTPDFGSLKDWRTRIQGTIVFYKDDPFYVEEVYKDDSKKLKELKARQSDLISEHGRQDTTKERRREIETELHDTIDPKISQIRKEGKQSKKGIKVRGFRLVIDKDGNVQRKKTRNISPSALNYEMREIGFYNVINRIPQHDGRHSSEHGIVHTKRKAHQQWNHGICRVNVRCSGPDFDGRFDILDDAFIKNSILHVYPKLKECLEELSDLEGSNSKAFCRDFAVRVDEIGHVSLFHGDRVVGNSYDEGETFKLAGKYRYLAEELSEHGVTVVKRKEAV